MFEDRGLVLRERRSDGEWLALLLDR
jgi:hypothetical protein